MDRFKTVIINIVAIVVVIGLFAYIFKLGTYTDIGRFRNISISSFKTRSVMNILSQGQLKKLRRAVEAFRLRSGSYPEKLEELVKAKILFQRDLSYPWKENYFYGREEDNEYILRKPH